MRSILANEGDRDLWGYVCYPYGYTGDNGDGNDDHGENRQVNQIQRCK